MPGKGQRRLKLACNGFKWLDIPGEGWEWLKRLKIAGMTEMAGNGWK